MTIREYREKKRELKIIKKKLATNEPYQIVASYEQVYNYDPNDNNSEDYHFEGDYLHFLESDFQHKFYPYRIFSTNCDNWIKKDEINKKIQYSFRIDKVDLKIVKKQLKEQHKKDIERLKST
jgi:SUMO ligase MMS21 Smc5/6 complex component